MDIVVVSQYFYPENFAITEIACDLVRRGHRVTVLTGMPNYPSGRFEQGYGGVRPRYETYRGVSIIRVPMLPRGRGTGLGLFLNYLSYALTASVLGPLLVRRRPDVVFVYQVSPLTVGLPALALGRIRHTPIVFWIHDIWPESLEAVGMVRAKWALRAVGRLARFIYRRCTLILVQSPALEQHIRPLSGPNTDIRYLPHIASAGYQPVELPPDSPDRAAMPAGFKVLFAGNVGAAQDVGTILDAAERLRHISDLHWVVIGEGRLKNWLAEEIHRRNLDTCVLLQSQQSTERMPYLFAAADALLVTLGPGPISRLIIPSKLQSYLACGRPVVASLDGAAADIVAASGAGVLCAPGDPAALAEKVLSLYRMDASERNKMGMAGRRYFNEQFEPSVLMAQLEAHLADACRMADGRRSSGAPARMPTDPPKPDRPRGP